MQAIVPRTMVDEVENAAVRLQGVALHTALERSERLSRRYGAEIYLKREDQQVVRSFKLRGAYNKVVSLGPAARRRGLVCASAGNHAQGVAFAAARLGIRATIFMPVCTPDQKIHRVRHFGGSNVTIRLIGETFDDAGAAAAAFAGVTGALRVPPFDDPMTIAGQGTIGREILQDLPEGPDLVLAAVGGGGLAAGIAGYLREACPHTSVAGAEPAGAPSMSEALAHGRPVKLPHIDRFVDGAAVQEVGQLTFDVFRTTIDGMAIVPEGAICTSVLDLYQEDGIIAEPAGALPIAALEQFGRTLRGKTVVCVLSGGNNDVHRYPEILERSLAYEYARRKARRRAHRLASPTADERPQSR